MKTRMGLETLAGAVLVCLGVLTLALIGAGCRGGLLESTSPEGAGLLKGGLTLNTVYNHPHSRAVTNVASVGTNSPMYQAGEGASEDNPGAAVENPKMGAYVTTPTMPATGAGQAATGSGKYVIVVAGDLTRQAEMEISSIASMLAGAKASNLGQGAAPALGPGAAGGAGAGGRGPRAQPPRAREARGHGGVELGVHPPRGQGPPVLAVPQGSPWRGVCLPGAYRLRRGAHGSPGTRVRA